MTKNRSKFFAYLFFPMLLLLGQINMAQAQSCNPTFVAGNECENVSIKFSANAPGFSTYDWSFKDKASGTVVQTSTDRDPAVSFSKAGTYEVTLKASGVAGNCEKTIEITIKPSPKAKPFLITPNRQCFKDNQFCLIDSSTPAPGSKIVRRTILFSDGAKYDKVNPTFGDTICHEIIDPKGGWFNMKMELEDANGCVTEAYFDDFFQVFPRLNVTIKSNSPTKCDSTMATITNQTYIDWKSNNETTIGLKDISEFVFDFGDSEVIVGDSNTNVDYWTGKALDGIIEKWYRTHGTFNATLAVTSRFGCSETFTYKGAATNIKLAPKIIADKDSACTSDPETCFSVSTGPIPGAAFLWNFGDPPSGPQNTDDKTWTPCHSYGGGPWMISLRIVSGPCDIMIFDTITKVGPSSTIEVPFVRVLESEKYQCEIRDSVHFVNNSSWYHNDPNYWDEDSFFFFYPKSFRIERHVVTGVDSIYTYKNTKTNSDSFVAKYPITEVLNIDGYKVYFDDKLDSFVVVNASNDTTRYSKQMGGLYMKRRYVFNYVEGVGGDQTAIPNSEVIRRKDHVYRLWTLGDNFAPPCTTDTKANKNVNLNCNFTLDSLPVHWYTPWDDIYKYRNNGQFYTNPAPRTLFSKNARQCYQVQVYAADTVRVPQEVVLFVPRDSAKTFEIPYVDSFGVSKTDTIEILSWKKYPEFEQRNNYRLKIWRAEPVYKGSVINTIIWEDQDYFVPAGITITLKNLQNGTETTVTGPRKITIEKDYQFEVEEGDSILALPMMVINQPRKVAAAASNILIDTVINGVATTVQRSVVIVDSAYHRNNFYSNTANCNSITLYHKDTIHPLECESSSNLSLALIPPNARGLRWESGVPCPLDGNKLNYYLTFNMDETKPGCSQQWFEVNYDSLTGPDNWINYKSGGILAPPPPGLPIPFVLPYDIIGTWGTQFVKGYSSGEIGSDPSKRPNGSFTIGLVIGNGPPAADKDGNPIAPECTDTAWYSDMFRYQYLDAQFDILLPQNTPLALCAGETAYFRMLNPIQDSIAALRWNWGYPDLTMGYYEQFQYFQEYKGPVKGRNDEGTDWKKGDKWLYNYVVRHKLEEIGSSVNDDIIDTIVTRIYREWDYEVNTYNADRILINVLKQLNLDIRDIPSDEFALMLGDGTVGCIDTTGISEFFIIGKKGIDENVYFKDQYKYKYTNEAKTESVIIEEVFHFRDSSIQGYDTLIAPYDLTATDTVYKKGSVIPDVYKFTYQHREVRLNFCDPTKRDTFLVNSNGPMVPGIFLNNRVGCEKSGAKLLNVGYLNQFELLNEAVCKDDIHQLYDSIRYWQYGDDAFPNDYPIDPRKFWEDPGRYASGKQEIKSVDWDYGDGVDDFNRSVTFFHQYDSPGEYVVAIASKDSIGCRDTAFVTAFVTGAKADFETNQATSGDPCDGIISFYDLSIVFDPCRGRDTCPNGVYEPCDSVVSYEWDFGDGSRKSILKNPSHDYTSSGWFTVKLIVGTLLGCSDSIEKQIYIEGPQPGFEFDGGSVWGEDSIIICIGDDVSLANTSADPMFNPQWIVYWGDTSSSSSTDLNEILTHEYKDTGTFYLLMYMEDTIEGSAQRCYRIFPDTSTKDGKIPRKIKVIVKPVAPSKLEISDTIVCPEQIVTFTSNSDTIYEEFSWSFGDGDTAVRRDPVNSVDHGYKSVGTYKVHLVPDYDLPPGDFGPRCPSVDSGTVTVIEPTADFDIDSLDKPEFCFTNTSQNYTTYQWFYETELRDIETNEVDDPLCLNWGETVGSFEVCLEVTNDIQCKDTVCKPIQNDFFIKFIPYNVFTPDSEDGLNQTFIIDIEGYDEYEINIYNRWGELVFKTNDPEISWDGTIMNKGSKCPSGTYFYVINYKLRNRPENGSAMNGEPVSGTVTLIR